MAKFFRFMVIVLLGWGGVGSAWAQQHGEGQGVSLTRPGRLADTPTRMMKRRMAQRRQALFRGTTAADPAVAANEADSLALVALFNATDGAGWDVNTNWLTAPVADWHGVTLNTNGRVTEVDLRENSLAGSLPGDLGDLTELEGLLLGGNRLHGPLPEAVTALARLKTLSLWLNALTGPLPAALGQQAALEDLLLFGNQFTGPIPPELGALPVLRRLWLDFNAFSGPIPPQLGDLAMLEELFLDSNQLTGPVPPELANLNTLIILSLGDNPLGGPFPTALTTMTTLQHLWLQRSGLTGPLPTALAGMTTLSTLLLNGNQITGAIPEEVAGLRNLTQLFLAENQLTGTIPESLGAIPNLRILDLHANALTGEIPMTLGFLDILSALDLGLNQLTGTLPPNLGRLRQVRDLYFDGNHLTGDLSVLLNMAQLTTVSLRGNDFTGAIPPLGFLPRLTVVDLGENGLTGAIHPSMGQSMFLERLLLDGNALTGAVPPELASLTNLASLLLNDNRLDALPDLSALAALDTVNVAANRLSFEDIEPNVALAGGTIAYAPQDTVETRLTRVGATVTFSVAPGGVNNRYQWFRDGVTIEGATADTLAVEAAAVAAYHCEITNTVATALTLTSRPLRSDAVATGIEPAPEDAAATLPDTVALYPNYPNPFNPTTRIAFDVDVPTHVRLTVYDVVGRVVAVPVDRRMPAGRYQAAFDAAGLPSGLYVYRIEMDDFSAARTMVLVR